MTPRASLLAMPWLFGATLAAAQPPPDPPPSEPAAEPEPAPAEPADQGLMPTTPALPPSDAAPAEIAEAYPQALAARPLLLPPGALEAGVLAQIQTSDFGDDSIEVYALAPRLKYSVGQLELDASAIVALDTEDEIGDPPITIERERLQAVVLAGRFGVAPDTALGVELAVGNPADNATYAARAIVAHKRLLSAGSAIELSGFLGGQRTTFELGMDSESITRVLGGGQLRVQAQLMPKLGVEARAQYFYFDDLGDNEMLALDSKGFAQDYGIRLVAAATPDLDVVAGVDFFGFGAGLVDVKIFSVGVAYRRVP